ncbi:uncharacterized protein [Antedon mediterranea]|uniref:uncharacterized protein n=1 Tax=Antedon mediterranea TaxID=105859 RepID=UPI003AF7BB72
MMHYFKTLLLIGLLCFAYTKAQSEIDFENTNPSSLVGLSSLSQLEGNEGDSAESSEIESESEGSDGGGDAPESSATNMGNNIEDTNTLAPPSGDINYMGTIESTTSVVIGAIIAAVGIVSISAAVAVFVMVQRRKQRLGDEEVE